MWNYLRYICGSNAILILLMGMLAWPANAQSVHIQFDRAPLKEALGQLTAEQGINFIYSTQHVSEKLVSCTYSGSRIQQALDCLLKGTDLRANKLNDRQYVLSPVRTGAQAPFSAAPEKKSVTIRGFVKDTYTADVLPGAHVYLPEIRRGTTTDTHGFFSLPGLPDTTYEARISYLGYKASDTLLFAAHAPGDIKLHPITLETDIILVEADRGEESSTSSVPGLVAMDIEALDKTPRFGGEKDLLQTLQWTAGVHKGGVFNNGLLVRGGFPDQNLYLVEGAPVYHPWHAFNLVSTFHMDAIENIHFFKGSFPAQHGGRLSSVLDTRLKDGSRAGPTATAGLSVLSGRFIIESPLTKNSSFMISGRRSYLDKLIGTEHPVQDANGVRDTLRTGYHFSDLTAKLSYKPGRKHTLSFSYYSGKDLLDLKLPFNISLDFSSWLQPAELFFEVDHNWGNRLYAFKHQYLPSSRLLFTQTVYRSSYNANEGEFVQPTSSSSLRSNYHVRVRDIGIKSDIDYHLSRKHHVQSGFHFVHHQFESSIDAIIQRSINTQEQLVETSEVAAFEAVGYLQDTWQPNDRWSVQPGLRLSYFSSGSHVFLSPRISAQHVIDEQYLILQGALGAQVQYIQRLRDRFSFMYDLVSSRWIPTNENTKPSQSFQVAIEGSSHPLPWLHVSSELYWRTSKNVLLPRDVFQEKDGLGGPGIAVGALLSQYTAGLSKAFGAEFTAFINKDPWKIAFNYSGARSLSKAPDLGDESYYATLFDVPRFFRSSITRYFSDWYLTLSTLLRSGYPITVPLAAYSLSGPGDEEPTTYLHRPDYNNGRLPPYFRFDLTIGYEFELLGADWTTQFHVYNLTNQRNVIDRLYEPTLPEVTIINRKGLPILPLFEIEMEL